MRRIHSTSTHEKILTSLLSGKAAWIAGVVLIGAGVVHKIPATTKATTVVAASAKPIGKPGKPARGPFQIIADALSH